MSKGGVTSVDTEDPAPEVIPEVEDAPSNSQEPPLDAPNGEMESPVKEKSPVKERRQKSYNFKRHRFTLHHSDYESN